MFITFPHPEPDQSNPSPSTYFLEIRCDTTLPSTRRPINGYLSPRFPHQNPFLFTRLRHKVSVRIVIDQVIRLEDGGIVSINSRRKRLFFAPKRPDQFWGPSSLLLIGYRWLFSQGIKWPRHAGDEVTFIKC